jgi:hypothetical protein
MGYLKHYMELDLDFNDLISTRIYSELLGCYRKRLKDPFQFIGLIEGQLAVFGNGRFWSKDVGINLHTMAFVPNHRLIWIMEYIKAFYAFEMMNVKEWWTSVESFNSWRMVGIDMAQPCYHWPEHQHEIGGSPVYYINEKYWNKIIKNYLRAVIGSELIFDIPHEVKTNNKSMRIPLEIDTKSVITKIEPDTGVSKAGISHAA